MISRTATLVLATLIAWGAATAMPPSRSRQYSESCTIVWQAETCRQRRVSPAKAEREYPAQKIAAHPTGDPRLPARPFFASLYQRPPPVRSF